MKKQIILITGTSTGIGRKCAEYLFSRGHIVYGTVRKQQNNSKKAGYNELILDVRDAESIKKGIDTLIQKEKKIDILINCAGIGIASAVELTTIDEYKKILDTNFLGNIRMIQAILPFMRLEHSGLIINISSMLGLFTIPFQGAYCASKFAIEGLTECLSIELKAFGIKTVLIEPGDVKSNFNKNRLTPIINHEKTDYAANYENARKIFIKDEENGVDALFIAKKIEKIIHLKKPKLRYVVGNGFQKTGVTMHKYLPNRIFENIFFGFYKQSQVDSVKNIDF